MFVIDAALLKICMLFFQRDGCWIGDCEPKKKEAIGEMFLHVHIKLSPQMIDFVVFILTDEPHSA